MAGDRADPSVHEGGAAGLGRVGEVGPLRIRKPASKARGVMCDSGPVKAGGVARNPAKHLLSILLPQPAAGRVRGSVDIARVPRSLGEVGIESVERIRVQNGAGIGDHLGPPSGWRSDEGEV